MVEFARINRDDECQNTDQIVIFRRESHAIYWDTCATSDEIEKFKFRFYLCP